MQLSKTKTFIMRKSLRFLLSFLVAIVTSVAAFAQPATITGTVRNSNTNEGVPAVSVLIVGSSQGTFTDQNGNFSIKVAKLPTTLVISSVGFQTQQINVTDASTPVQVSLQGTSSLGQEVVISATRTPQRILESPVTVERVSSAAIRNSPAASFYDIVGNLKGVDMTTASLTFKTPTTRGFSGSGNLRFNQLVDGMDNQAPGLNFSVGAVLAPSELDVESMELLQGASSALYGPGGMNGTLLINTKNPFKYQGLSFQVKTGLMHTDGKYRDPSMYNDWSLRWGKTIGQRFAFKISTQFVEAKDWVAADYRGYTRRTVNGQATGTILPNSRETDPNYDGVNTYGDETTADLRQVLTGIGAQAPFLQQYINSISGQPINVSRTGYREVDIINPETINFKLGGSLNYKVTNNTEAILEALWGTGNTVYTGSDRYSLKDLKMGQYKAELNNKNWFLRAYTTQEDAGQSFNATVTTRLLNEAWKPSGGSNGWYAQYGQAYLAAKLAGAQDIDAHNQARAIADIGRPAPGSTQFQQLFDQIRSIPISKGGGLFVDKTSLYNVEGQYNLSQYTQSIADILVGGNFKRYVLNSEGTLFADSAGKIGINEYGAYVQATRGFADNRLRLTVSGRYDKNQNFEGRFTPRATALIKLSEKTNFRLSYQTAYRFPSTQQQWINLNVSGGLKLIGGVQQLKDFYHFSTNPLYDYASLQGTSPSPKQVTFNALKPESVSSYEAGIKSLAAHDKLLIDFYGYYGQYTDFILRAIGVQSTTGNAGDILNPAYQQQFSVPVNSDSKVTTWGAGLSLEYTLPKGFYVSGNVSTDVLDNVPAGFLS
jgi:outer membrane receptor protein involved in Fe transport